ncbi:MAG: hypothetical protein AAF828_09765 [Bacteroidota bacterium]
MTRPSNDQEPDFLSEFCTEHHLPLDWNEQLSLEDYLHSLEE